MVEAVNPFKAKQLEEKRKRDELRLIEEAKAARLAQEKARQKQLAGRSAEDAWFFDGVDSPTAGPCKEVRHEDDQGFQMLTMPSSNSAPSERCDRQVKVTSLIDFDECNVADAEDLWSVATDATADCKSEEAATALNSGRNELDLLAEIQHLQQRLKDAEEEKNIQLLISSDEVTQLKQDLRTAALERDSFRAELEHARSLAAVVQETPTPAASTVPAVPAAATSPLGGNVVAHKQAATLEVLREARMQVERQVEWMRERVSLGSKCFIADVAGCSVGAQHRE